MALNDIKFQKQVGGMGRTAASEDPVSGLILSLNGKLTANALNKFDTIAVGETTLYVAKIKYFAQLEAQYGIKGNVPAAAGEVAAQAATRNAQNAIAYHVSEFFRMSPEGTLFLTIRLTGEVAADDIKNLQYYAQGTIRQVGVFTPTVANLAAYQVACTGVASVSTGLEQEHQPLSVILGVGKGALTLASLKATSHVTAGRSNLSMLISCDLAPEIIDSLGEDNFAYFGCVGNVLGAVSKAAVNESIAYVAKFPLGLSMPGFITGELLREVSITDLDLLNDNRYIFVLSHVGDAGNYYNDSHTLDIATSDYAYIENVRTMDKATRGIRTNLLPYLNSPLQVDAETGTMSPVTVSELKLTAGKALEEMEKKNELSGYVVEIDPNQNVIATSEVEIQIKNVPTGIMRMVRVKIGFTTSIN
jgi:hypothetical protein